MKQLFLIFFFFFFIACESHLENTFSSLGGESDSAEVYLSYREKHPTRDKTLNQVKVFYNEAEICKDSQVCSDLCEDLYQYDFDKKGCKSLPSSLVNQFNFFYNTFKNKNFENIQEFNSFDFKAFLSFSLEPSMKLFDKFGVYSAKDFLNILATNWDIAHIFVQEDLDFILLKNLLNEIAIEPISALGEIMENGQSFQEIALTKQNDYALFLIHNFFTKLCNGESKCILDHYCSVSKNYSKNALLDLSRFKNLRKILTKEKGQDSMLQSTCSML